MLLRRSLKIGLLIVLLGAIAGIIWSFFSRSRPADSLHSVGMLDPDISQQSTDFLHSEFKLGRLVFRVRSVSHSTTASGMEKLEAVELVLYDDQGEASDVVRGENARYEVAEKQIEFSGNVRVRISDGTELMCERLSADMSREEIRIDEEFEFVRGSVRGRAATLLYRLGPRLLELGGGFRLSSIGEEEGAIRSAGHEGIYDIDLLRLSIVGDGLLSRGDALLEADEIDVWLTEAESIEKLVARQRARFTSDTRLFSGDEIIGEFDAETGELTRFLVFGERIDEAGSVRASFRQTTAAGENFLEADRILGLPFDSDGVAAQNLMKEFEAQGNVRFRSAGLRVDDSEAGFLRVEFRPAGRLKGMDFRRGVRLYRTGENGQQEWVNSNALSLEFDPSELLQRAYAVRDVEVGAESPVGKRSLACQRSVELTFEGGTAERATGYEDCVAEFFDPDQNLILRAPWLTATFAEGLADAVAIRGGVSIDVLEDETRRRTRSDIADLQFANGRLSEMVQTGNFSLETRVEAGTIQVRGDRAVFSGETQTTLVSGEQGSTLNFVPSTGTGGHPTVTKADKISLDQSGGGVRATGNVQTVVNSPERKIRISSGTMEIEPDTGWVDYSDGPVVENELSRIEGRKVRYGASEGVLRVEDRVTSLLRADRGGESEEFSIESGQLTIRLGDRRALYENDVRVHSEDFDLAAPSVELLFHEDDGENGESIREVQAWGGVEIREEERKATGEKASYYPDEEKVVVTGEKATITDVNQGQASGRRLVFYIGQEKLTVESAPREQP